MSRHTGSLETTQSTLAPASVPAPAPAPTPILKIPSSIQLMAGEIIATEQGSLKQWYLTLPPDPIGCFQSGRFGVISKPYSIVATPVIGGTSFIIPALFCLAFGFQGFYDLTSADTPIINISGDFLGLGSLNANAQAKDGFIGSPPLQNIANTNVLFKNDGVDALFSITGTNLSITSVYR